MAWLAWAEMLMATWLVYIYPALDGLVIPNCFLSYCVSLFARGLDTTKNIASAISCSCKVETYS